MLKSNFIKTSWMDPRETHFLAFQLSMGATLRVEGVLNLEFKYRFQG